jgi:carboxyl-terminal processing protease
LFGQGVGQLAPSAGPLGEENRAGLEAMLEKAAGKMNKAQEKDFSVKLASLVLSSLPPAGRSGLYTAKEEQKLEKRVANVDLKTGKVEPTTLARLIGPNISYIRLTKISPATFDEFRRAAAKIEGGKGLDSLILDLRGNVGGSIDALPYLLGPFIGQNQYAYEFFHQGERLPFKTKTGWLSSLLKYKKVVVLIDGRTQSSAELMASVLKKYNVGVLLGERTRGWGTVEKVFQIKQQISDKEKYSVFLVHSLALRDDDQPIEGHGVEPTIKISDADWEKQLFSYFRYPELAKAVKELWRQDLKN